jgi:hypothetical protein
MALLDLLVFFVARDYMLRHFNRAIAEYTASITRALNTLLLVSASKLPKRVGRDKEIGLAKGRVIGRDIGAYAHDLVGIL